METLSYEIIINAPKQKVWNVLWGENTYSEWTKFFNPNSASYMKSDWKIGGKTYFVNNEGAGMVSTIDALVSRHDVIVYDADSHACIVDGVRLHMGKSFTFKHNDMAS